VRNCLQPPHHERAYQLCHRGTLTLGKGAQHLGVVVVQSDELVMPALFAQAVVPLPVPHTATPVSLFARCARTVGVLRASQARCRFDTSRKSLLLPKARDVRL
jgi:hypothetical protein